MSDQNEAPTMREIIDIVKAWVDGGMKEKPPKQVTVIESNKNLQITINPPKPPKAPNA